MFGLPLKLPVQREEVSNKDLLSLLIKSEGTSERKPVKGLKRERNSEYETECNLKENKAVILQ